MNKLALILAACLLAGCASGRRFFFPACHADELVPDGRGGFLISTNPCRVEAP